MGVTPGYGFKTPVVQPSLNHHRVGGEVDPDFGVLPPVTPNAGIPNPKTDPQDKLDPGCDDPTLGCAKDVSWTLEDWPTMTVAFTVPCLLTGLCEAIAWGTATVCIGNPVCRLVTGMAGGVGGAGMGSQSPAQIGQNGVNKVLNILKDPSARTEQSIWVVNDGVRIPYPFARFDIVTTDAIHEVKNVADLSLSQDFMDQAYRYKLIADSGNLELHYWLVNDAPQNVQLWLQRLGIVVHVP
jgi:hypothetical protein